MKEIMIATDVILEAIIGRTPGLPDELIARAQRGEAHLNILHSALYCALYSVDPSLDKVNVRHLSQLLKYSQNGDCQGVAMHATDVALLLSPLAGKAGPVGVLTADAEESAVVVAETANTAKGKPSSIRPRTRERKTARC